LRKDTAYRVEQKRFLILRFFFWGGAFTIGQAAQLRLFLREVVGKVGKVGLNGVPTRLGLTEQGSFFS
jgi:hypothetical protein